jgi:hypothetical protein
MATAYEPGTLAPTSSWDTELLALPAGEQLMAAQEIAAKKLSVRDAERLVGHLLDEQDGHALGPQRAAEQAQGGRVGVGGWRRGPDPPAPPGSAEGLRRRWGRRSGRGERCRRTRRRDRADEQAEPRCGPQGPGVQALQIDDLRAADRAPGGIGRAQRVLTVGVRRGPGGGAQAGQRAALDGQREGLGPHRRPLGL